jgi:hypothetical protein
VVRSAFLIVSSPQVSGRGLPYLKAALIGEKVRHERRWTSAGVTPARKLVPLPQPTHRVFLLRRHRGLLRRFGVRGVRLSFFETLRPPFVDRSRPAWRAVKTTSVCSIDIENLRRRLACTSGRRSSRLEDSNGKRVKWAQLFSTVKSDLRLMADYID